jgi:hypothetical protein
MNSLDNSFLRTFYRQLRDQPLEPDDPRYIPLYGNPALAPADPVEQLLPPITWGEGLGSVQLFSGFRGTGKSTELRRLRARLHSSGNYKVVLCDMQHYINLTTRVDVSDFLIALAGAFSDALRDPDLLGSDPSQESYWKRFVNFLTKTKIDVNELSLGVDGVGLKAGILQDPSFKSQLQDRLKGHLGALTADVHSFFEECVRKLKDRHGPDAEVVFLLDSIEQIRGTSVNAEEVYASVETLFFGHSDKLRLPFVHVVYTVPPWLKIQVGGVAGMYDGNQLIPCVKVREKDGTPFNAGLDAVERLVRQRGDWERLLGKRAVLDHLCAASGGFLRDLFRLLQSCLRQVSTADLPVTERVVDLALHEVRNSYLPLSYADAGWLERVAATHQAELVTVKDLGGLSRFFDTHLVLCYRNGDEWYDVHPLIRDHVRELAKRGIVDGDALSSEK